MSSSQLRRGAALPPLGDDDTDCNVLHVDMDAFFAGVELRERPELRGRPVIIGRHGARSVVTSATYEARAYGVHSAMPMARAMRLCPTAIVIEPSHGKYSEASKEVMSLLREFAPTVEVVSVDEAFLNVAGTQRLIGSPGHVAREIRARCQQQTGLTCSVGVAATTTTAKIASTLSKPDGLLIVPKKQTVEFLRALPVGMLPGVGEQTAKALDSIAITTVADIAAAPAARLEKAVGKAGAARLLALTAGQEVRGIEPRGEHRSISSEHTFEQDVYSEEVLIKQLNFAADHLARKLRKASLNARCVSIKLRFSDFRTIDRSHTFAVPVASSGEFARAAKTLLGLAWDHRSAIRLIGLRVSDFVNTSSSGSQLTIDSTDTDDAVGRVSDEVIARFGPNSLRSARQVGD